MNRRVEPELLDTLPADDPGAVGSRRDLQRLNEWMGHGQIMARALGSALDGEARQQLVELGAGDGEFMLRLARQLSPRWPGVRVTLVDQQEAITRHTRQALDALGWRVECVKADVFDWIEQPREQRCDGQADSGSGPAAAAHYDQQSAAGPNWNGPRAEDGSRSGRRPNAVIANLFLHHFDDARLAELLRGIARKAGVFIAVEPRRSRWSFEFSRQLWAIGCNRVTRHDAPVSVRAGFTGKELSSLWPADGNWRLEERPARWLSHLFVARLKK